MGLQSEEKIKFACFRMNLQYVYIYPTIAICVLYILYNIYSEYHKSISGIVEAFLFFGIQYFGYKQIMRSHDLGLDDDGYNMYISVLGFNVIIILGHLFRARGTIFYYGMLFFSCGKVVWKWQKREIARKQQIEKSNI